MNEPSDEEPDPLCVALCKSSFPQATPLPFRVIKLSSSVLATDLFSEIETAKRPKSLKMISKSNHEIFDFEMSKIPPPALLSSPPLIPNLEKPIQLVNALHSNGFERFISNGSIPVNFSVRGQLFARAIEDVRQFSNKYRLSLQSAIESHGHEERRLDQVIARSKTFIRKGIAAQRHILAITVLYHRTRIRICKHRVSNLHHGLDRVLRFRDYLQTFSEGEGKSFPTVDIGAFALSLRRSDPKIAVLKRHRMYLRAHRQSLVLQRPGTGDWTFNILHPDTKSGKVIE
jgi:hypothetical protein